MSLNCLIDYIGIRGCTSLPTPPSGLYINSLPGVSLEMIDKIADSEQVDFFGVWDDVQLRAVKRFRNEVNAMFAERYKLKTMTQSVNIEKRIDTTSTTAAGASYRGFTLELNLENQSAVPSNLQSIYIQYLTVYSNYAGSVTVKIFDLDTETQIYTSAQTFIVGWNQVSILQTFAYRRLYVVYAATNIISVNLDIEKLKQAVLYNGEYPYYYLNYPYFSQSIQIKGATSTIADPFNITYGSDTFGMSGIFSVLCSFDALVCNNLTVFETAFWYLLGSELMYERAFSDRLNEYTAFDRDSAKELNQLFNAMYRGGEVEGIRYPGELNIAIGGVNLNQYDHCLECNAPIRYADAIL